MALPIEISDPFVYAGPENRPSRTVCYPGMRGRDVKNDLIETFAEGEFVRLILPILGVGGTYTPRLFNSTGVLVTYENPIEVTGTWSLQPGGVVSATGVFFINDDSVSPSLPSHWSLPFAPLYPTYLPSIGSVTAGAKGAQAYNSVAMCMKGVTGVDEEVGNAVGLFRVASEWTDGGDGYIDTFEGGPRLQNIRWNLTYPADLSRPDPTVLLRDEGDAP